MVDKIGNLAIIISATPLNRTGKEPGTGALSHPFANQTKLYFGLRITRQITGLFKGVATLNSNRSGLTGDFLLTKNETTPGATNAQGRSITRLYRSPEMRRDCTESSRGTQIPPTPESSTDSLSQQIQQTQAKVDSLMESIIDRMEELASLIRQLQALQEQGVNCG